jgi:hypothetical protein
MPHLKADGLVIEAVLVENAQALDERVAGGLVLMEEITPKQYKIGLAMFCLLEHLSKRGE